MDKIRDMNRRTLDSLGAKAYFYFSLFHEELDPKPPSKQSPVIDIRGKLLAAMRSAVLRKDPDTQASVTTLLLRNYISTAMARLVVPTGREAAAVAHAEGWI